MHTDDQVLEVLLDQFHVNTEQVTEARERHPGRPILEALQEEGSVQPREIHGAIAHFHGLSFADLADENVAAEVRKLRDSIPGEVARRHRILPLQNTDHGLQVAIGDPMNFDAFDTVPFLLKAEVEFLYADPDLVEALLVDIYPRQEGLVAAGGEDEKTGTEDEAAIISLVQDFLEKSQEMRASDIHLEPVDEGFQVRFRIDGELERYRLL
ncbi:MAG: Flp pilus assembly complex ATPase component, partial [Verrucomicrobiota bacterium]